MRTTDEIRIDGDLSDPAWKAAAVVDTFYETEPADNTPPSVKTTVYLTYDEKYFYIGIRADDPNPGEIRAPYVDRDQIDATQDHVVVFLDTRNDRRSAMEFSVNPRGSQADAVWNEATFSDDFTPDFFHDTAAKVTSQGWRAEIRIPFSSLRYAKSDPQSWGILVRRNYPREFRYRLDSSPIPRGSNCLLCHMRPLTGLAGLPSAWHLVLAPYLTLTQEGQRQDPFDPASEFVYDSFDVDGGVDVKWTPAPNHVFDGTYNPDFSQVESDVAQIAVNERFALFFPELRPFFLEGVDLFETPIAAVHTRTITSPLWGTRATGKLFDSTAYTLLVTQDRGGGSVVLPGPTCASSISVRPGIHGLF